jgi:uncharacterized protein YecT (DUF1311 family)
MLVRAPRLAPVDPAVETKFRNGYRNMVQEQTPPVRRLLDAAQTAWTRYKWKACAMVRRRFVACPQS